MRFSRPSAVRKVGLFLGALALLLLAGLAQPVSADDYADARRKIALVIGLKDYRFTAPLINTVNDATLIAGRLRDAGFVVHEAYDTELPELRERIAGFLDAATGADVGIVYYSGHGIQIDGQNYIVPVEFNDRRSDPLQGLYSVSSLLSALGGKVKARAAILDACRNNPFRASVARMLGRKDLSRGLAPVEMPVADAVRGPGQDGAHGLLVGYATQPFDVADDGVGGNSPYAEALRDALANIDEDMNSILVRVARTVLYATSQRQRPELRNALSAPLFLVSRAKPLQCDSLAAEEDNNISVKGVAFNAIDGVAAEPACRADLARFPTNPRLMHNLARVLDKVGRDEEAVQLYRQAAELGFDWSQNNLAIMLMNGEGTAINFRESLVWMRRAYAQGLRQAAVNYTEHDLTEFFLGSAAKPTTALQRARSTALQRALQRNGFAGLAVSGSLDRGTLDAVSAYGRRERLAGQAISWQLIDRLGIIDEVFVPKRIAG